MYESKLNGDCDHTNAPNFYESEYQLFVKRISRWGLIISLCAIICKVYYSNRDYINDVVFERNLVSYDVLTENGEVMFKNAWKTSLRYSSIWLPLLCGFLATYFTWIMVYLDSNVPGVQPPSPLSPSKYKQRSGHTFHLNYIFAFVIGLLIAVFMYINEFRLDA